jgi:hypothetical protein
MRCDPVAPKHKDSRPQADPRGSHQLGDNRKKRAKKGQRISSHCRIQRTKCAHHHLARCLLLQTTAFGEWLVNMNAQVAGLPRVAGWNGVIK